VLSARRVYFARPALYACLTCCTQVPDAYIFIS
jgi:hypothetical protein